MSEPDKTQFPKKVLSREKRKLDPKRQDKRIWFGLGMFGMVGWSIAIPAVVGSFLGIWIDSSHSGRYSWTLMLFMAGLCLGCYNAWYWLQRERREITGKNREDKK